MYFTAEYSEREKVRRRVVCSCEKLTHLRVTHGVTFFSLVFTLLVWGISLSFPENPKTSSLQYPGILHRVEWLNFTSFAILLVTNIIGYFVEQQVGKKTQLLYVVYIHFICAFAGFMTVTDRVPLLYGMTGQRFHLIRHLVWIFTTPVFVLMTANRLSCADKTTKEVNFALAADIVMISFGAAAEIVPPVIATIFHVLAYVAFMAFLRVFWKIFQRAIVEQSEQSKYNLTIASLWCQIIWWVFPAIASLNFVSMISMDVAEALYTCAHLLTKIVFTSLLVQDYCLSENEKDHLRNIEIEKNNQIILFRQLEKLVEQKNAFLSSTSHELRTPIHGIIGLSQALLGGSFGNLDERISRQLSAINNCGSRLELIVSNILEVAAVTSLTRISSDKSLVQLLPLVNVCVGAMHSCFSNQLKLEVDSGSLAYLPPVFADVREIKQILHNLLTNAVKFTNSGKVSVFGEAQQTDKGSVIKISIQDTGLGIPESELVNIFEPFVQVDSNDTRTYGGAGLGLSVVKKMVNMLGGQIFVTSQVGKGSTFSFTMPAAEDDLVPDTPKVLEPDTESVHRWNFEDFDVKKSEAKSKHSIDISPPSPTSQDSGSRRLHSDVYGTPLFLILEEDCTDCFTLSSILESIDMSVQTALSYEEAITFLQEREEWPDCILVDAQMLCDSEFEAVLAEFPSGLKVPIIALSSNGMNITNKGANVLASAFKHGVADCIRKPFNAQEVVHRIRLQLSRQRKNSLTGSQDENLSPGPGCDYIPSGNSRPPSLQLQPLEVQNPKLASSSYGITSIESIPQSLQLHPLATVMAVEVLGLDTHLLNQEGNQACVLLQNLFQLVQNTLEWHQVHLVEMSVGGFLCIAGHNDSQGGIMHAAESFQAAQAVISCVNNIDITPFKPTVKVGMHVGPVYTGAIASESKCCILGETVSFARHLLAHGHPNTIHMSNDMADELDFPSLEHEAKLPFDTMAQFTCPDVEGKGVIKSVLASPLPDVIPNKIAHCTMEELMKRSEDRRGRFLSEMCKSPHAAIRKLTEKDKRRMRQMRTSSLQRSQTIGLERTLETKPNSTSRSSLNQTVGRHCTFPQISPPWHPNFEELGFNTKLEENEVCGIEEFLEDIGLAHYATHFQRRGIGMSALYDMNDEKLKELGVAKFGARMRIVFGIQDRVRKPTSTNSQRKGSCYS